MQSWAGETIQTGLTTAAAADTPGLSKSNALKAGLLLLLIVVYLYQWMLEALTTCEQLVGLISSCVYVFIMVEERNTKHNCRLLEQYVPTKDRKKKHLPTGF